MSVPSINAQWLLAKLQRERYELTDPKHTVTDLAARGGWNRRADALISEIRIEIGLQELRDIETASCEAVDLRLKLALVGGG